MIGAVIYELQAENSARLPLINGRLMHGVFFKIITDVSPALGKFIHTELKLKPFTVSFLEPVEKIPGFGERWQVRRGDKFYWRVTGLNKEILQIALSVSVGDKLQVGGLSLCLKKIVCDKNIRSDSGIMSMAEFVSRAKDFPSFTKIYFEFVSPVSFRIGDFDAPYPRAELIYGSLVDNWTQAQMPAVVDKKVIRDFAEEIRLTSWQGSSRKFYLAHDRGTLAFFGKFLYNLEALSDDVRKVFLLLAKFGEFSGVGRLTGQGFGQVRVFAKCRKDKPV